jgi:hypothetical protein
VRVFASEDFPELIRKNPATMAINKSAIPKPPPPVSLSGADSTGASTQITFWCSLTTYSGTVTIFGTFFRLAILALLDPAIDGWVNGLTKRVPSPDLAPSRCKRGAIGKPSGVCTPLSGEHRGHLPSASVVGSARVPLVHVHERRPFRYVTHHQIIGALIDRLRVASVRTEIDTRPVAKNPGCWANVLDDCRGKLTGEHLLSVAVWAAPAGAPNNRKAKMGRRITVLDTSQATRRDVTVRNLTRHILCEHHNNSTNDLDEEGGTFARSIEQLFTADAERHKLMHPGAPRVAWQKKVFTVDGGRLERWFMKTAINHTFGRDLPIGGPTAAPGWPTSELVEMVFGRRSVSRDVGGGLFVLAATGHKHDFGERFELQPFDRLGQYIAGCLVGFRTLLFGVNFEPVKVQPAAFAKFQGARGTSLIQPFHAMDFDISNVELRLNW